MEEKSMWTETSQKTSHMGAISTYGRSGRQMSTSRNDEVVSTFSHLSLLARSLEKVHHLLLTLGRPARRLNVCAHSRTRARAKTQSYMQILVLIII
eukprot:361767-Pleurochrysis_carterae.AAC.1